MITHYGFEDWLPPDGIRSAATLGNFDGVHLGHQAIISRVKARAAAANLRAMILTFDPVPKKVLSPETAPALIQTLEQRLRQLELAGMDEAIVIPFTREFASQAPEEFVKKYLVEHLHIGFFAVGDNFTFGRQKQGTLELLRRMGKDWGFEVEGIPEVQYQGARISSTLIRERVKTGAVDDAMRYLGHPFALIGTVVEGERVGSRMGIPTANLGVENELIPAHGVYVCTAVVGGQRVPAVTNIGVRPTFGGARLTVEAHLLDYSGDLYGSRMELEFLQRLRPEKRFSGPDELKTQILRDIAAARSYFA